MASTSSASARLARQLRELRQINHTTGSALARRLRWSQSRVSKIETGAKVPSREELVAWIGQTGVDASSASSLWRQWDSARAEQQPRRRTTTTAGRRADPTGYPDRMIERVQRDMHATSIMEYQPAVLPSTLATAEYMTRVYRSHLEELFQLDDALIERTLAQRERQQQHLLDGRLCAEFVLEETVLYNRGPGTQVLIRQLDRLQELVRSLPNLDLAVRPCCAEPMPVPSINFAIHDRERVHVQGIGSDFTVDEPAEVDLWCRGFEKAQRAAARGDAALALIDDAKRALRSRAQASSLPAGLCSANGTPSCSLHESP